MCVYVCVCVCVFGFRLAGKEEKKRQLGEKEINERERKEIREKERKYYGKLKKNIFP